MPRWGYDWELTVPQIELMQADLPHTLFLKDRKDGNKGGSSKPKKNTRASDRVLRLQEEANRKAAERRRARESQDEYSIEEIFNK